MGVKAIFTQAGQDYWIDVAAFMHDHHDWEPAYFVGNPATRDRVRSLFPNAVFLDNKEAVRGGGSTECRRYPVRTPDQPTLEALAVFESIYLKMLDRFNSRGSLNYHRRIHSWHAQLAHWLGVFEELKPDVVVFPTEPHMGYDWAIFAICTYLRIPTVNFIRTGFPCRVLAAPRFDKPCTEIIEEYRRLQAEDKDSDVELCESFDAQLQRLKQDYSGAMPFHQRLKFGRMKKGGVLSSRTRLYGKVLRDAAANLLRGRARENLKKDFRDGMDRVLRHGLQQAYDRLTSEPDFQKPFVFVALQCDPERQCCPCGGFYGHQELMVRLLAECVPEGWEIVIKEHNSMFRMHQKPERARDPSFYERLAEFPNVRLVPLTYTSFDLIDAAKATATVSGTVGWESVVRETPALLFGHSWYRGCEGVFAVRSRAEVIEALGRIAQGATVDRRRVRLFAKAVQNRTVDGYVDKIYSQMSSVPREENVRNLGREIHRVYMKQNTKSMS
ncbi:Capsule polysaccharide biosynthesis protein [Alkalidesulfovibrio alkalitolerans DSM 16529]|uniref:Capsule polysaccharide biosynthesis protein n=1 Tax=Alkalidesulfovibrio alkalitolerans DSM 16529 TaxID=1121439 RepID=S7UNF7_9BACT|nr:capsule polysaccharide biosynthesis protein [Alkalidesulfovibrio alkalitolerans]EPR35554.1 Capsule polysaccharide biosynthesis protein [Alkalidesulfovibrio alkalitolerans DSM 16529]